MYHRSCVLFPIKLRQPIKEEKYFLYMRQGGQVVNTSCHPAVPDFGHVPTAIAGFVLRPFQIQMDHTCK